METITNFDKKTLPVLRAELNASIKAVADKFGISLLVGNISYQSFTATIKIDASAATRNGKVVDKAAADFIQNATMFGLKPSDLNKVVTLKKSSFRIVGSNSSARRYPIILENIFSHKQFIWSSDSIRRALEDKTPTTLIKENVHGVTKHSTRDLVFSFLKTELVLDCSCKNAHKIFTETVRPLSYESFNDYWRAYNKQNS